METVFCYLIFSFCKLKPTMKLVETLFLGKTLFPQERKDFLSTEKCFVLFRASSLQVQTVTETSCNK